MNMVTRIIATMELDKDMARDPEDTGGGEKQAPAGTVDPTGAMAIPRMNDPVLFPPTSVGNAVGREVE